MRRAGGRVKDRGKVAGRAFVLFKGAVISDDAHCFQIVIYIVNKHPSDACHEQVHSNAIFFSQAVEDDQ